MVQLNYFVFGKLLAFHNPFTVGATLGEPAAPTGAGPMSTEGSFALHGSAEQNTPPFIFSSMTPPQTPRGRLPLVWTVEALSVRAKHDAKASLNQWVVASGSQLARVH